MTALPPVDPNLSDQTRIAIVRAAYEVLLGREADAGGLETLRRSLRTHDSLTQIVGGLLGSAEGRQQRITGHRLARFLARIAPMSPDPALAAAVQGVAARFLHGHALDTNLTALPADALPEPAPAAWIALAHEETGDRTRVRFCAFGCAGQTLLVTASDGEVLQQVPIAHAAHYAELDWPHGEGGARGFVLAVPALGLKQVVRLRDRQFRERVEAALAAAPALAGTPEGIADCAGFDGGALRLDPDRLVDPALAALYALQTGRQVPADDAPDRAGEILSWYVNDWALSPAAPGRLDLTPGQAAFLRGDALAPGVLGWPVSRHILGFARATGQLAAALGSRDGLVDVYARFLTSPAYPRLAHADLVPDDVLTALAAPCEVLGVPLNRFWSLAFGTPAPAGGGKAVTPADMGTQALLERAATAFAAALLNGHHPRLIPTDWFRLYKRGLDGAEDARPEVQAAAADPDLGARIAARAGAVLDTLREDDLATLFSEGAGARIAGRMAETARDGHPLTVVGHPGGSGLAKNGRMFRAMLREAGLAWRGVNVDTMRPTEMSLGAERLRLGRAVNLFAVNGDRFGQAATRLPDFGRTGRAVNIGFFLWETTRAPKLHLRAATFADEIWTPTEFVRTVYRDLTGDRVNVVNVGKQIDIPADITPFPLGTLGIPAGAFTFLNVADFDSSITRKNPLAAVRAFRRAFPDDPDVRLILKVRRVVPEHWSNTDGYWSHVEAALAADPRIVLLTGDLPEEDYWGLLAAADAFVTLHKGEGFGYGAAHAMFLGKPVIATDFSGTQDFCTPETAFLVPGDEVPVRPGQMHFAEDLGRWMEADLDEAARQMALVRGDDGSRTGPVTEAARAHVTALYGAGLFHTRVLDRLEALTG